MKHYAVVAHEAFKEPDIYFYEGTWTIEKLKSLTINQVQEDSSTEYEKDDEIDIYIDYIFESDSPIKWIYS